MSDALREKYETEFLQMAGFALWKHIIEYLEGMREALVLDVCGTFDIDRFRLWKGELEGVNRILTFLKDPLKHLAKEQQIGDKE